jgi:PKD repeat protein
MKQLSTLFTGLLLVTSLSSLAQNQTLDPTNMREGESVEYCRQHIHQNAKLLNPAHLKINAADQREMKRIEDSLNADQSRQQGIIYKIPIVFHVLHNGGNENISRDQILDALEILNRDFRRLNTDANGVVAQFQGMPADVEIEFVLATKAPNGNCFSGITRTQHPLSNDGSDGDAQVNAIVAGNDVFNGQWAGNRYLNVFICGEIGGAAGYTYNPNSWIGTSMKNGIWILHNYTGSIGTSSTFTSRTLTHEVGHWLNLSHTWGGNNNPGNASSCSDDDDVDDTPRCIGLTSCNLNANTCSNDATDGYWTSDVLDNTENYMDYSYCSKMFTPGQVTRMRAATISTIGGRNNLWSTSNLNTTGTNGTPPLCKANFMSNKKVVCVGDAINFTDDSYHNVTSWTWTFNGGTPSNSSAQNPSVTYNTPGTYAVTLVAGDGSTTVSETKSAFITVLPTGAAHPITEGFETFITPNNMWIIDNPNGTGFETTTTAASSGAISLRHVNGTANSGSVDEFVSSTINLQGTSNVTLTFKYAFATRNTSNTDNLKVLATNNCGDSWSVRKNFTTTQLATAPNNTGTFIPTADQWTTVIITNITSTFWVNDFRFKFQFTGGGGNTLYIDDINLYNSNTTALGVEENEFINAVQLFPNPTTDYANLTFNLLESANVQINVVDMIGKTVQVLANNNLSSGAQRFEINTTNLSKGIYLINIVIDGQTVTHKLIVD